MKILVPVDGSSASLDAVQHALELLRQGLNASLVLANVQEPASLWELLRVHDAEAIEAISRTGLTPVRSSIRGGTDGSRLSFMGLPCPNIFAGEHAFHSRLEWVSRQDMEKAAETIVHLAMIWEERA